MDINAIIQRNYESCKDMKGDTITVKVKKLKTPIAVFYSKRE